MLSDLEIQQIADRILAALVGSTLNPDEYVDSHGAAKILGCSVPTVERRTRDGSLQSVKFGRLRRYLRTDLLAMKKKGGSDA
jgi:excisionase family DNA binding protein